MADDKIKKMVDRFLRWKLPDDFMPDGGVSFTAPSNPDWWPIGTNLLTATQATEMIEYILGVVD
jgi:hypothetical protein